MTEPAVPQDGTWAVPPEVVYLLRDDRGYDTTAGQHGIVALDGDDDVLVLPAWSSLDLLVQNAGPERPWVALHASQVEELRTLIDAVVVLDAVLPSDLPQAEPPDAVQA